MSHGKRIHGFQKILQTVCRKYIFSSANARANCLCSGITLTAKGSTSSVIRLLRRRMHSSECMSHRQGRFFLEIFDFHVSITIFSGHDGFFRTRFLALECIARHGIHIILQLFKCSKSNSGSGSKRTYGFREILQNDTSRPPIFKRQSSAKLPLQRNYSYS